MPRLTQDRETRIYTKWINSKLGKVLKEEFWFLSIHKYSFGYCFFPGAYSYGKEFNGRLARWSCFNFTRSSLVKYKNCKLLCFVINFEGELLK